MVGVGARVSDGARSGVGLHIWGDSSMRHRLSARELEMFDGERIERVTIDSHDQAIIIRTEGGMLIVLIDGEMRSLRRRDYDRLNRLDRGDD